jgi:uncharacterized protein
VQTRELFFEDLGGGRSRLRAGYRLLLQFVVFAFATVLFGSLLTAAQALLGSPLGPVGELRSALPTGAVASLISMTLTLQLMGRYFDKRPFGDYGFRLDAGWWLDLGFGMLLGAALMSAVFLVQYALGWASVTGSFEVEDPGRPFALALLPAVIAFVAVGFYEEMLARGYQLKNLAEGLNFTGLGARGAVISAWIATSLFFGFLHAGNPSATLLSTANIALAGLFLGAGYVLTGQLAIPIGLHITWNFFQGNVFGFAVSGIQPVGASFLSTETSGPALWTGGEFGPEAGLLLPFVAALAILLTFLWVRLRTGEAKLRLDLAEPPKPAGGRPAGEERDDGA